MSNRLRDEASPYLLQHADNPVNWYPWGEEAFSKAKAEDKPVFLSIGYSTCHWCHVMARESFEDEAVATRLNAHFVAIKVDREERPDIDSIYMAVCQAFTGSGGWPTSIFMTPERKPFFAGTYFPRNARYGAVGFYDLLGIIHEQWQTNRAALLESAEEVGARLARRAWAHAETDATLIEAALAQYKRSFDRRYGGFGDAPKFPAPHNLLFLMTQYEKHGDRDVLRMVETTLTQMYRGGLFDHIGYGFCRYSTDRYYLAPHFEKMLYDNALMISAYCRAYTITQNPLYRRVAEQTAAYILREMTDPAGGFYSAQDADSEGVEGGYYTFTPAEVTDALGKEDAEAFCRRYDITDGGNFEGKSIPNLLEGREADPALEACRPRLYDYRRQRSRLSLDDKILTAWNGLMIAAMCRLYRVSKNAIYLTAARKAQQFIEDTLLEGDTLFVSARAGRRGERGFLDDYACYIHALTALYEATRERSYLDRAVALCHRTIAEFYDEENGGFYLYGRDSEQMIFRPKESYDGAIPSGNSMMAYNLVRLGQLTGDDALEAMAGKQLGSLSGEAKPYPMGYAMFLTALSDYLEPPARITVVCAEGDAVPDLDSRFSADYILSVLEKPTAEYPLKNGRTTFYVCRDHRCLPPVNALE